MSYFGNIRITNEDGDVVAEVTSQGEVKVTAGSSSMTVQTWSMIELSRIRRLLEIILGEEVREEDTENAGS